MSTIDELNSKIRMLEGESNVYKEQLTTLHLKQSTEHVTAEQERLDDHIKFVRISISENNKKISELNQIILQKERQIAADKEKDAANAKFRAERGETNSSPCFLFSFLDNNIILRPLLASFLKSQLVCETSYVNFSHVILVRLWDIRSTLFHLRP